MVARAAELLFAVLCYAMSVRGIYHHSVCLDSKKSTTLDFSCPDGHMLQIIEVLHGYNGQYSTERGLQVSRDITQIGTDHNCSYTTGDCKLKQQGRYECVGSRNCSLPVRNELWLPSCQQHSNYVQVDYACVLATTVHNICDNRTMALAAQNGYITSPNYPLSYPPGIHCKMTVQVLLEQTIELYVIDMNLKDSEYLDCLMMSDHISSNTWCNSFANERAFHSRSNTVTVQFSTNEKEESKGFWVYYRAIPPLEDIHTTNPTVKPTTPQLLRTTTQTTTTTRKQQVAQTNTQTTVTTEVAPSQRTDGNLHVDVVSQPSTTTGNNMTGSGSSQSTLPVGAIIGLVLGCLVLIMLALIILLVVRRVRERRQKRSDSLHMIFT